jgi:hypothetical protein
MLSLVIDHKSVQSSFILFPFSFLQIAYNTSLGLVVISAESTGPITLGGSG